MYTLFRIAFVLNILTVTTILPYLLKKTAVFDESLYFDPRQVSIFYVFFWNSSGNSYFYILCFHLLLHPDSQNSIRMLKFQILKFLIKPFLIKVPSVCNYGRILNVGFQIKCCCSLCFVSVYDFLAIVWSYLFEPYFSWDVLLVLRGRQQGWRDHCKDRSYERCGTAARTSRSCTTDARTSEIWSGPWRNALLPEGIPLP